MFITKKKFGELFKQETTASITRKEFDKLLVRIGVLESVRPPLPSLVTCKKCGCAVLPEKSYPGKSIIDTVTRYADTHEGIKGWEEEIIKKTYYCKQHRPRQELK